MRIGQCACHRLSSQFKVQGLILLFYILCFPLNLRAEEYDIGIDAIQCYIEDGQIQKAEDLMEKMLGGTFTLDNDIIIDTIQCYLKTGDIQKAADLIEKVSVTEEISAEIVILNIILNHEVKGEFFVNLTDDGDILVRAEDLRAIGFREPAGHTTEVSGEIYMSLRSMQGVEFILNEKTLSLEITALPALLPKKTIDFMPQGRPRVYYPKDTSAFLNYSLSYSAGDSFRSQNFNLTNQLGLRLGDILFLSDSSYTESTRDKRFVRLMSNITYDRRKEMQRLAAGDFFASSGNLGSSVNLGGISFSKIYCIDPYFINRPMLDLSGFVSVPSDVEIYLDGMRIRTEKLSPGEFELKNVSYYSGARILEVVIKDPFGREQRLRYPFYFTDILLKRGLHEYSYNIGFMREGFGEESNRYGDLVFSAFHKYGISDSFNIGIRGEAMNKLYNLGSSLSYLIPNAGVVTLSISGSTGSGGTGIATSIDHTYQGKKINTRLIFKGYSEDYATVMGSEKIRYEGGAGIGYGTRESGSVSFDFTTVKKYQGQDRQTITATYSKTLTKKSTIFTTFKNIRENRSVNEFFIGITYYPWTDTTLSLRYEKGKDTETEILQIQKNPPLGEGIGLRTTIERVESQSGSTYTFNPFLQYNWRYGIFTGEFRGQSGKEKSTEEYHLSASGGIAYVGNVIGFSRPINDSFGLVKVEELEGVRVYAANQEIGRTDLSGRIFVPALSSYHDNQISINDKDIPIDYSISEVVKYISPPFRSGAYIKFDVTKIQAITGRLKIKINGDVRPVEFYEVKMMVDSKEIIFPTGKDGEFYLENIKPGRYITSFNYNGKTCSSGIIIPETEEMIVDLGEIICEDTR